MSKDLLEAFVREVLSERGGRKRRGRRKKPGGPRTDIGALRQLNPDKFRVKVKAAMNTKVGDVSAAAKELDVSQRTLYHYLDDDTALHRVKTSSEREDAEEKNAEREKETDSVQSSDSEK